MKEKIQTLIINTLLNYGNDYEIEELKSVNSETKLYNGLGGCLDSLALVNLISDLEEILSEEFKKDIILADEKMMSSRNSPFKDVQTLAQYIASQIKA
ncbi:hypothetical protein A0M30_03105 [Campylobacter jejuni]|uniref:hypothetical protein n=1 Tax=Campylobacter jejuni TaxID=197 RepID=UPI0008759181|nr:hypothetical protein [Campylobacter jejuni]EBH4142632.1 hypothetical protein [Campylobacter jejuni]ECR2420085.1 hypothetical protein [Campylobacter jejuni]EHR0430271.1 hypothetical protein [Campylobacter jejuni]EJM0817024.1 hypothetical protein [Campylobacter jejuni]ELH9168239.1 hypothetical protein [Campylobacter jejuni]